MSTKKNRFVLSDDLLEEDSVDLLVCVGELNETFLEALRFFSEENDCIRDEVLARTLFRPLRELRLVEGLRVGGECFPKLEEGFVRVFALVLVDLNEDFRYLSQHLQVRFEVQSVFFELVLICQDYRVLQIRMHITQVQVVPLMRMLCVSQRKQASMSDLPMYRNFVRLFYSM